jgi:hypothetical protein
VASAGKIDLNRRDILLHDFVRIYGRGDGSFYDCDPAMILQSANGLQDQTGLSRSRAGHQINHPNMAAVQVFPVAFGFF